MKEEVKQFSINDIEIYRDDDDVDFAHVKIYAFAEKNNSHKNPISLDVLKRDADTILGKFIVAKFSQNINDTEGHETDEVIVGYIDPREKVTFEEKEVEGEIKTFLVINGLLSKIYATEVVEMFRTYNERTVSCEFSCNEAEEDENGDKEILGYWMHGITILGLSYRPSIKGTEIKVMKFAEEFENSTSLKSFAEKRKEELKTVSHPIDKSKDSLDTGDWNGDKAKQDLVKEKNYKTLAKSVCLKLKDGWEDRNVTSLGYPVMNLKDGKWVYNSNGLSSALQASNGARGAQKDEEIANKVIAIQKKLGLYKEESMTDKEKKLSEPENDKEKKDIVMEEDKNKEKEAPSPEKDKPIEEDKEKEMGCGGKGMEDKKFSLDAYVDSGAMLAMLEAETEQNKELAQKVMKEMSAEEIVMQFVSISKELAEFKAEKAKVEEDKRNKKLYSIMLPAKENLTVDMFVKLYEEGKVLALEELDGFNNKVKAFVDENKVSSDVDDGIMKFADSGNLKMEQENIDVFEKIDRK